VVGCHLKGSVDYRSIGYKGQPVVLLMGNEQAGLPDTLAQSCSQLARIPQAGRADSLNLAIATGVMLFEARRHLLSLEDDGHNECRPAQPYGSDACHGDRCRGARSG
jgi:TrmH family RNA methyltransferase